MGSVGMMSLNASTEFDRVHVMISDDHMSASINLNVLYEGDPLYTKEEVMEALKAAGVKMGIDEPRIERMIVEKEYCVTVEVATGKPKQDGVDGRYELFFDLDNNGKPKIKEDGSVDYYDIKLFEIVNAGDKLAEYIPPTSGTFGFDVRGLLLTPRPGRPKLPLRGKGFITKDEGKAYYAAIDGKVEYRNSDLNVLEVLEINGNVDLNVGNINFNGDVNISGNVISGVTINARGNVYVGGFVEGATIRSEKNIVFRQGINGNNNAVIEAKGDIHAGFIENVHMRTRGSIYAEYMLNSTVLAEGKIIIEGKRGTIHGGNVIGVLGIESRNVGSDSFATTIVRVGACKELKDEYTKLIMKVNEIDTQIKAFDMITERYDQIKAVQPDLFDQQQYNRAVQSRIIKNSEKKGCKDRIDVLFRLISEGAKSEVKISDTLYPGARVVFDGGMFETNEPIKQLVIKNVNGKICAMAIFY